MRALLPAALLAACAAPVDDAADDDVTVPAYVGGWPVNADKDALGDPAATPAVGARFARFELVDQHGDLVDTWDFLGHGAPVVVQVMAAWCPPCLDLGDLFAGRPTPLADAFPSVRDHVRDGRVYWLTVMVEDADGAPPDADDLDAWAAQMSLPQIPVLDDGARAAYRYTGEAALPSVWLLDDQGIVLTSTVGEDGGPAVLQWLEETL